MGFITFNKGTKESVYVSKNKGWLKKNTHTHTTKNEFSKSKVSREDESQKSARLKENSWGKNERMKEKKASQSS